MLGIILKLFGAAIGSIAVYYAAATALRSARRLDKRIQEFKEEQEELQKQRGPINPYAALADLYAEQARQDEEAARRRAARRQR